MLIAQTVNTEQELQEIISLQKLNLKQYISEEEKKSQGFLTMSFTMDMLLFMHAQAPSIILKNHDNKVVAYAISFLKEGLPVYPEMTPLVQTIQETGWKGRPLSSYNYYIMGQICVAKEVRGMGAFDLLYQKHKEVYGGAYDCLVTEISSSNTRSLRAHQRVGFRQIALNKDAYDEWQVVLWDWQ